MSDTENEKQGCLSLIGRLFGGGNKRSSRSQALPYRLRDDFLSPAEFSFYRVLAAAIGDQVFVAPKVRLSDVFFVPRGKNSYAHQNRINQKHVHFLLCDRETMKPLAGIELDDSSHRQTKRMERDLLVNRAFEAAGLPLERVNVKRAYTSQEIGRSSSAISLKPVSAAPQVERSTAARVPSNCAAPICPKCGVPMVIRTVKQANIRGAVQRLHQLSDCRERKPLRA